MNISDNASEAWISIWSRGSQFSAIRSIALSIQRRHSTKSDLARNNCEAAAAALSHNSPDKVDTDNPDRGPLLLTMGGKDHTVPEAITKSTMKQYRKSKAVTEIKEYADRGHSLTIDHGWQQIADDSLAWLDANL